MYFQSLSDQPALASQEIGHRYRHSLLVEAPSPLAGAGTPWRAGNFLEDERAADRTNKELADAELGAAIFRFVFERY